jgi:hypothetical protein
MILYKQPVDDLQYRSNSSRGQLDTDLGSGLNISQSCFRQYSPIRNMHDYTAWRMARTQVIQASPYNDPNVPFLPRGKETCLHDEDRPSVLSTVPITCELDTHLLIDPSVVHSHTYLQSTANMTRSSIFSSIRDFFTQGNGDSYETPTRFSWFRRGPPSKVSAVP